MTVDTTGTPQAPLGTLPAPFPPLSPASSPLTRASSPLTRASSPLTRASSGAVPAPAGPPAAAAPEDAPTVHVRRRIGFTISGDGSYAACLAEATVPSDEGEGGGGWFVERWSLDGPEPYAVALPGAQPEEPGTQVLPLPDGRVLVRREVGGGNSRAGEEREEDHLPEEAGPSAETAADGPGRAAEAGADPAPGHHDLSLLYPSGTGTGTQRIGGLTGTEVRLLPPAPFGAFATCYDAGGGVTSLWQLCDTGGGSGGGPAHVLTVPGRCTGGVWLDRGGRLLALDRALDGRTKAVVVDLHVGQVSPLLQLTEDSDDRLLLAEPDSGLMIVRSDATGEPRLGWGVLGSRHPVRFPDTLRVAGALLSPVAAQPGQILTPEACVVAFRSAVPGGAASLALWRPGERRLHWRRAPADWLGPAARWLPRSPLHLPSPTALHAYDVPPVAAPGPLALPAPRVLRARALPPARRTLAVLPLQKAPLTPVA
ncbi:hypothetical protein SAMN05216223_101182 [Actinacidiphila yanglinensis]|uniref:Uncharacterized protein n=1 Tax=Actinacidiphila yanglinensis TaxID=310779 RepID=A0A1H5SNP2_9ACTN|nr:hypothetical protein [Actinacidiphila yanglinensis]SEF51367.1 hypothetical protein SAMN05216223_101182 [Actinacidiphila yanglinensis]